MARLKPRNPRGQFTRLDEFAKRMKAIQDLRVTFGPMGPNGGPAPQHGDSGMTSAEILKIHEFGLGVPERSVIRWVQKAKRRELLAAVRKGVKNAIDKGWGPDQVAKLLGELAVKLMRERILSRIPPPLAESTLTNPKRDKRGIPLLDTEQILNDLGWAVDK